MQHIIAHMDTTIHASSEWPIATGNRGVLACGYQTKAVLDSKQEDRFMNPGRSRGSGLNQFDPKIGQEVQDPLEQENALGGFLLLTQIGLEVIRQEIKARTRIQVDKVGKDSILSQPRLWQMRNETASTTLNKAHMGVLGMKPVAVTRGVKSSSARHGVLAQWSST